MNITHNTPHIITPLKALWRWLMAEPGQAQVRQGHVCEVTKPASFCPNTLRSQTLRAQPCASGHAAIRGPLRVLRVFEPGQPAAHVGRMRISGRMADVCAELDRLAACEARLH